jgi:hypothetical protein
MRFSNSSIGLKEAEDTAAMPGRAAVSHGLLIRVQSIQFAH